MMRSAVLALEIGSMVAVLGLIVGLVVTAVVLGEDVAATVVFIAIAALLALSTAYQNYRLFQRSKTSEFPQRNLPPIAALLIFGGLILVVIGAAISEGGHAMGVVLPGFLIQLALVCVARYKFAT
jgi:hypothetical protein